MTRSNSSGVVITITGQPPTGEHQTTHFVRVRRRVRHGQQLDWHGHTYAEGAIVTLQSDAAFDLEKDGVLEKLPGVSDAP